MAHTVKVYRSKKNGFLDTLQTREFVTESQAREFVNTYNRLVKHNGTPKNVTMWAEYLS